MKFETINGQDYKVYKVLGHQVKIEYKPPKKGTIRDIFRTVTYLHQKGWEKHKDKTPMPWNVYTEGLTTGEHYKRWDFLHTVLKYRLAYPLMKIIMYWIVRPLQKKRLITTGEEILESKEIFNKPLQAFERAWSLAEDDFIKYYAKRYNCPVNSWSPKIHKTYKTTALNLKLLRLYKQMAYTLVKYDTAYREFFVPLYIRAATEFNKEYCKNPVEHVMYHSRNIQDVQYPLASEVLYRYRHGFNQPPINTIPAPSDDTIQFDPAIHELDKKGKVRFKKEYKIDEKTKELKINTRTHNVVVLKSGELVPVPKGLTLQQYDQQLNKPVEGNKLVLENVQPALMAEIQPLLEKHGLVKK